MTAIRLRQTAAGIPAESQGGRLLAAYLVSLLLHGLLLFGLTGGWLAGPPRPDKAPVYYVDLVHKPVLNPQAGRPEPRVAAAPPAPAPKPAAPLSPVPAKTTVPARPAPAAKPAQADDNRHVAAAMEKLRAEQQLQQRLADLRRGQTTPLDVPVGLPDARGTEAGVTTLVYVQATIQQNWALSPYLLADVRKMARIEAWVRLTYNRQGRLERFSFERVSGDLQFDESIKRALVKSQQLPAALPERLEDVRVIFNLKTLAESYR
jgi:hypothetical protein